MAEVLFDHKHEESNGDVVEIRIHRVPISNERPQGVLYSCVYVREGKRLIAYDNYGEHGQFNHHRHIKDHIGSYEFVDIWKLLQDFNEDVEKIKQGIIK